MIRALKQVRRVAVSALALALVACSADESLTGPEPLAQASVAALQDASPSLLYCPTRDSRSVARTIGPNGGQLTLAGTKLIIPAGAVPVATNFVLTIPASDYLELDIVAGDRQHYEFAKPVTIRVNYAHCRSDTADVEALSAWHIDPSTGSLLENMGGFDNKHGRKVTFETDHLSKYAIAW